MTKPTCKQLEEVLGTKPQITICSDIVHGLNDEYYKLKKELRNTNRGLAKAIKRRSIYRNRYLREKQKNKELEKTVSILHEFIEERG